MRPFLKIGALVSALFLLTVPAWSQAVLQSGSVTPNHIAKWQSSGHIADGGAIPTFPTNGVMQSGTVTGGHVAMWTTDGVVQDGGTAAAGKLTSLGITNNGGPGLCINSDLTTSAGYNQLCLSVSTNSPALISLQNYGSATAETIQFVINGTPVSLIGNVVGVGTSSTGSLAAFGNNNASLIEEYVGSTVQTKNTLLVSPTVATTAKDLFLIGSVLHSVASCCF